MIKSKKDKINFIIYDNYVVIRGEEGNKNKGIRIDDYKKKTLDMNIISDMNFENTLTYLNENGINYSNVEFL